MGIDWSFTVYQPNFHLMFYSMNQVGEFYICMSLGYPNGGMAEFDYPL